MITKDELDTLIAGEESFRVEKTISTTNMDKFCEAICAFANDMPNSRQCGYLLIGDRITVFEAKIAQAKKWDSTTPELPNLLSNQLHNPLPDHLLKILSLMQKNPGITYPELAAELHVSKELIRRYIKELKEKHRLISRAGRTRGTWITCSDIKQ